MQLTIIKTFVSRFLILILSFGLVIYSTNMWGSEGKGTISIVVANAAAVSFFSSIFSGSSASSMVKSLIVYATRSSVVQSGVCTWSFTRTWWNPP